MPVVLTAVDGRQGTNGPQHPANRFRSRSSAHGAGRAWTDEQIARLAALLDATDADEQRWAAGDALVAMLPVDRHARNGAHARIRELAANVGRSEGFLRSLRTTSANWPEASRRPWVNWHVARIYTTGGSEAA